MFGYNNVTMWCNFNNKIKIGKIPDFDILCAGWPCQPFSIAGKKLGFEDKQLKTFDEGTWRSTWNNFFYACASLELIKKTVLNCNILTTNICKSWLCGFNSAEYH